MVVRCSNGVPFVVTEPEPSVRTGIRVEIYDGASPATLLEILENSFARRWHDPLRGTGSGEFSIHVTDPKLTAAPGLLAYGNIARFYLDNVARFAITIEHKRFAQLSEGEDSARVLTVSGRGVQAKLEDAQVYRSAGLTGDVERPFTSTAGQAIRALIAEAQARGGLVGITTDFGDTVDSNNAPYTVPIDLTERAGTDLLRVAERHGELAVDVYMTPDLRLQYFNERGLDVSVQGPNIGPVILRPGDNIAELEDAEDGSIKNVLLIETPTSWLERIEGASITTHRRREGFLSLGNVTSSDQVDRAADSIFDRSANPGEAKTLQITDKDQHRPYVDFGVGYWVQAPNTMGELERYRVRALTVSETDEGEPLFTPELSTVTEELEERLERWLAAMARGTMGGTAGGIAEPVKATAEVTTAITAGLDNHVATTPHVDELSDLADVDVTGLADGDLLQYDAGAGDWVPLAYRIDISTAPTNGQILKFDASTGTWKPATESGGGGGGGGGPSTSLYRAASLVVSTSTDTTVAMDTTDWDDDGWESSGSLLLPAGTYLVTALAEWGNMGTTNYWLFRLGASNSEPTDRHFYEGIGIRSDRVTGSKIIRVLAGGDTISLIVRHVAGSNRTLDHAALQASRIA